MKRIAALRDLSDDHHGALVVARRCVQSASSGDAARAEAVWREVRADFARQLEPHFEIEERLLLPALEAIGEQARADRIREDHASLRALARLASPSPAQLERFGRALEAHVRFEERDVFEVAQARLPAAALGAIAAACRARALASGT